MSLFFVIWIAVGACVGALISAALGGRRKFALVSRCIVCACGAVAVGLALPFFGFEPGGPYPGAVLNAAIGGFVALPAFWFFENTY
jgi:uncharacterized membrane protein YeaQ/YmgE (transglycosylase-associated protein family)